MQHEQDFGDVVAKILNEQGIHERAARGDVTPQVAETFGELSRSLNSLVDAGSRYAGTRAELNARPTLTPNDRAYLQSEARREVEGLKAEFDGEADRALRSYKAALTAQALPRIAPEREALGRQELDTALRGQDPAAAVTRLAAKGSREAVAVLLNTSYGATALEAAGAENVPRLIKEARETTAAVAAERGSTAREQEAGKLLKNLPRLQGAKTAAVLHINEKLAEDERVANRETDRRERANDILGTV